MQSVFHGLCKYIAVHSGICKYEILSKQVHTGTYWYMRVHPLLTCFGPGCSPAGSRESGRIAAAERHTRSNRNHFIDFFRYYACACSEAVPAWPAWPAPARPAQDHH